MIFKKTTPWGYISGKLSLTPEQAMEMFGFKMKPNAQGVIIEQYRDKTVIINFVPPFNPRTQKQQLNRKRMAVIVRLSGQLLYDIIHPAWNPLARGKPYAGVHLFRSVNMERIGRPPKWENLLLTRGLLPAPKIQSAAYYPALHKLTIKLPHSSSPTHNSQLNPNPLLLGIVVFDSKTHLLQHFLPQQYNPAKPITLITQKKFPSPIVFLYYKKQNQYSNSTSTTPTQKGKNA